MRIRSFHIDAFGTLRDVTAEGLPEAGAVFLGHNEAGKSTLLDFFRSTLVGYPRTRDARERGYLAGQSGLLGGSLTLFSDARGGDIRLIRRPNVAKGEPLLTDAQGRPLDPALWERLLGGVPREVYASVYGFSLSELQSFASLTAEGVRNALYGASFGMAGLKSPGAALKKLTGSMEDLFRARGSNPRLSAALKEWEDVRRDMRRAEEDAARYDSLAAERDAAQGRLAALREERAERERERRVLERRKQILSTLAEEIDFTWQYYTLQKIRFDDRIELTSAIDPALRNWRIPSMSLQTLVENAVKHNSITGGNPLHIRIRTEGESFLIENNYTPRSDGDKESLGMGLERIRSVYRFYTEENISISVGAGTFRCRLPLLPPEK